MDRNYELAKLIWGCEEEKELHDLMQTANQTYKQKVRQLRDKKEDETPIVEGHRLYYNFIKPHMALNGKTPSEEAGITIDGENKWLTLMKKSIQYQKSKDNNGD